MALHAAGPAARPGLQLCGRHHALRDGKPRYLADAPRFIHYIRSTCSRYRELTPLLRLVDQIENIQPQVGWAYGRV